MARLFGGFLLLLALGGVATWTFRLELANRFLPDLIADRTDLNLTEFQVTALDMHSAHLSRLAGRWRDGEQTLAFNLNDTTVHYLPWEAKLESVRIASASVSGDVTGAAVEKTASTDISIPLIPLGIGQLEVDVLTAQGRLQLNGALSFDANGDKFQSTLEQPAFKARVSGPLQGGALSASLEGAEGTRVFEGQLQLANQALERISGRIDLPALSGLLRASQQFAALVSVLAGEQTLLEPVRDADMSAGDLRFDVTRVKPLRASIDGSISDFQMGDYRYDIDTNLLLEGGDTGYRILLAPNGTAFARSTAASANGDLEHIRLHFDTPTRIDVVSDATAPLNVVLQSAIPVTIQRKGLPAINARLARAAASFDNPLRFETRLEGLSLPDFAVSAAAVSTTGVYADDGAQGATRISDIRLDRLPPGIAPLQNDLDWQFRDGQFIANGRITAINVPAVTWELRNQGRTGELEANWREPANRLTPLMAQMIEPLADKLELTSGQVAGALQIKWNGARQTSRLDVHLNDVGASLWGIALSSLDAHLTSDDVFNGRLAVVAQLKQAALGIGADVLDTRLQAQADSDQLQLEELSFAALGGTVRITPTRVDLQHERHDLLLAINHLDLGELLRVLDISGLSGEGRLSGRIPLQITAGGAAVVDAELTSDAPGVFRYLAGDAGNPAFDNIGLKALRNFQFDNLRLGFDYGVGGTYRLKARIVGRNPEVLDGRLVALNPDIQGKLPGLLLAILLGDFDSVIRDAVLNDKTRSTEGDSPR